MWTVAGSGQRFMQITIRGISALMAVEKIELNNIDVEAFTEIFKNKCDLLNKKLCTFFKYYILYSVFNILYGL